jgi:hypothetical protein
MRPYLPSALSPRKNTTRSRAVATPRRPTLERLEDRTVPSSCGLIFYDTDEAHVLVHGTDAADTLSLSVQLGSEELPDEPLLVVDHEGGECFRTPLADVAVVEFQGFGGDDWLTVSHEGAFVGTPRGLQVLWNGGEGSDGFYTYGDAGKRVDIAYYLGPSVGVEAAVSAGAWHAVSMQGVDLIYDFTFAATLSVQMFSAFRGIELADSEWPDDIALSRVRPYVPDGTAAVDFTNKTELTLQGVPGADVFLLNNPVPATGLELVRIEGDPAEDCYAIGPEQDSSMQVVTQLPLCELAEVARALQAQRRTLG